MAAITRALTDAEWDEAREAIAQRFIGVSATEFVENFNAGLYDGDNAPDLLMEVLGYFPELN